MKRTWYPPVRIFSFFSILAALFASRVICPRFCSKRFSCDSRRSFLLARLARVYLFWLGRKSTYIHEQTNNILFDISDCNWHLQWSYFHSALPSRYRVFFLSCNFLHSPIISSPWHPNILHSILLQAPSNLKYKLAFLISVKKRHTIGIYLYQLQITVFEFYYWKHILKWIQCWFANWKKINQYLIRTILPKLY